MCASLVLSLPAPGSRALCARGLPVRPPLGRTPLLLRASLREGMPPARCDSPWRSTPTQCRHRPPQMHCHDAHGISARPSAALLCDAAPSASCLFLGFRPFRVLCTPDSPHRDRPVRPSARCQSLARSLQSRSLQLSLAQLGLSRADLCSSDLCSSDLCSSAYRPPICRRIAILPRPNRLSRIFSAPARNKKASYHVIKAPLA